MHLVRIVLGQPNPGRFVVARLLRLTRLSHLVTFRVHPLVRIRLYPSTISLGYWMDAYDADDREFFERFVRSGDTVVDVGANIGVMTILSSALVGPSGRVISIEAHPATYEFLLGNLRLNGCSNVTSLNLALGVRSGVISFSDAGDDDLNRVAETGIQVRVEPLDAVVRAEHVDLLKIDVEGYERFVLEGATATLERTEAVFFESWDPQFAVYGYRAADVGRLLVDAGFEVFRWDNDTLRPVEPDYDSQRLENLLAVRDRTLLQRLGTPVA